MVINFFITEMLLIIFTKYYSEAMPIILTHRDISVFNFYSTSIA